MTKKKKTNKYYNNDIENIKYQEMSKHIEKFIDKNEYFSLNENERKML